jgi:hypothetical protein
MLVQHRLIATLEGSFLGWPANNGLWTWDDGREIVVGCVAGAYDPAALFHAIRPPYTNHLLRSRDGGDTWEIETPQGYVGAGPAPAPNPHGLDFTHPGFALRATGDGYHGSADPGGSFYTSLDRGRTWNGPYRFSGLETEPALAGLIFTPRTDVLVLDSRTCLVMLSVRPDNAFTDRVFCVRTRDGARTFQFAGWVVPPSDPSRGVMPATVFCPPGRLVSAVRRRAVPQDRCWIDAYASVDSGGSWELLGKISDTGGANGNPPALLRLADGGLVCVYGRRDTRQMAARASRDEGRTWGPEQILRDDFYGEQPDFGYPRLARRADGRLMAFYYWATRENPHQHIAASIFTGVFE